MSAIVKMEKAYNCLNNFRNNCNNKEYKKLIDTFFPMLYQENKCRLEINVGKMSSHDLSNCTFSSLLSMVTTDFIIKLSCYNDEPLFIVEDVVYKTAVTVINLTSINNLQIETKDNGSYYIYDFCFNYKNEIDYLVHIAIDK